MLVLAIYSTGSDAHDRVQDNEAFFCEHILVTTMHVVYIPLRLLGAAKVQHTCGFAPRAPWAGGKK